MLQKKRLEFITEQLQKDKSVYVNQLSQLLCVTPKTVRMDLEMLEKAGVLQRVHGGAVLVTQYTSVFPIAEHRQRNVHLKRKIAQKALSLIKENEVILLDDGSTSLELAKLLGGFKMTVLTNDILIINELMYKANVQLYVVGGLLKRDGESFVVNGEDSVQFIKKYRVNKLFLGISTIDIENGLMIFYYGDRSTKRAFIAAADEVICMVDSTKFNQTAFTRIASIHEMDTMITDSGLPVSEIQRYQEHIRNVLVAE